MFSRFFCILPFLILLQACAAADKDIVFEQRSISVAGKSASIDTIYFTSFADGRPDRNSVGQTRNGYAFRMADVQSSGDALGWVRTSLVESLRNSGYKVNLSGRPPSPGPRDLILSGRLLRIHSDVGLDAFNSTIDAEIQALMIAEQGANRQEKTIIGLAATKTSFVLEDEYQQSINGALDDFVRRSIGWINSRR